MRQALENFDAMPDAAIVRVHTVAALFACGPATIWRRAKLGTLPAPVRPSPKVTGWRVGDLRAVLGSLEPSTGTNPGTQYAREALATKRAAEVTAP